MSPFCNSSCLNFERGQPEFLQDLTKRFSSLAAGDQIQSRQIHISGQLATPGPDGWRRRSADSGISEYRGGIEEFLKTCVEITKEISFKI